MTDSKTTPSLHASSPEEVKHRLLLIHGGCFKGGNSKYDERLSWMLTSRSIQVIRVDFDTSNAKVALKEVRALMEEALKMKPFKPLWVGGVSSGAWFACQLARNPVVAGLILLCPVVNPHARWLKFVTEEKPSKSHLKKAELQMDFFQTEHAMYMDSNWTPDSITCPLMVLYGNQDEDASFDLETWINALKHSKITFISMDGGHELCTKFPNSVADNIEYFINS